MKRRSRLKHERLKRNLTQKKVADAIGIEVSHYAGIEIGKGSPSLERACKLEKFFNVPVCELLKRDGDDE